MKRNEGISLIVLVITIIVMIILAGAIILSLNNAGIIGKANEAVDMTNETTVRQMVELKWAEAYLDSNVEKTDVGMYNAVMDKLKNELGEQALLPYDIQVTTKGATVEKLPTVDELQETYKETFKYYSSLRKAIDDVNNETIGTEKSIADATKSNAKAGVYIDEGNINVILLSDEEETSKLILSKDMTLNLGGNELIFKEGTLVGIDGVAGNTDTITIDGRLAGSKIIVRGSEKGTALFQTKTNTFVINGGTYIGTTVTETTSETFLAIGVRISKQGKGIINNAQIDINVSLKDASSIENKGNIVELTTVSAHGDTIINNCKLNLNVTGNTEYKNDNSTIAGINVQKAKTVVNGGEIYVNSVANIDGGIHIFNKEAVINNCDVTCVASGKSIGVANSGETKLNLCNIKAISDTNAIGLYNGSNITLIKCNISGKHTSNVSNKQIDIDNAGTIYEE